MNDFHVQLIQLPLHPGTAWEATGNIPLAPALLAAAANLPLTAVFPEELLDSMGDTALLEEVQRKNPGILGVTLYLWNRERTVNLVRNLKKWNPELLVVAGGPEVTMDNRILLEEPCIDLFVAGEGESFAKEVLDSDRLKEIIKSGARLLGPVVSTEPPDRWPDPYKTGHISVVEGGSVHIETQRGCQCLCSYCAYRKVSPVPRITPAAKVLERIGMLREMGAGELVFLDPTFNGRSDLSTLLTGMSFLDLECFAEVRGDLVRSSASACALAEAGFKTLEVGLQTMNSEVLRAVGRGGNPLSVLQGASLLAGEGIAPVMDLILGLPGDNPSQIEAAARHLVDRGLHEQVQTFCLSVLPGTELRAAARKLEIAYDDRPPYCITKSGRYTIKELLQARDKVSDILGYDADTPPRPVLSRTFPGLEVFIPEKNPITDASPSVRHGVLHINTTDAWENRNAILMKVTQRRARDPYCPLDVVIRSTKQFPLDLVDMLSELCEPECYTTGKAEIYGIQGLLRLAVIASPDMDPDWISECSILALTVIESASPVMLPDHRTGLLLAGSHDLALISSMYSQVEHLIFFREQELEMLWNLDVLELG